MQPHSLAEPADRPPSRALLILWPAFLMAGVLEALVFALVDPHELSWPGGDPLDASRLAVYSISFLLFWAVIATAGAITALLQDPGGAESPWPR